MSSGYQRPQLLRIVRGEDVLITATFAHKDPTLSIAGWAVKFAMSLTPGGAETFAKTVGNGITIVDPTKRIITIAIEFAVTDALVVGTYYFDIWRTDSSEHGRLATGTAVVEERVAALP